MLPPFIGRTAVAYVALCRRRSGVVLLGLGLLALLCALPIARLDLRTDIADLLPDAHPAVAALHRLAGRQMSSTNLVLLIASPDDIANQRFADALIPKLGALVPSLFSEVQSRENSEIPDFARRWRWLYAEREELERADAMVDRLMLERVQPLAVDIDGDPESELRALREKLEEKSTKVAAADHFGGVLDGTQYRGLMLWRRGNALNGTSDRATLVRVKREVEALVPTSFNPQLRVLYTGHIAMALAESDAIRDDLTLATGLCFGSVLLVIFLYFRRIAVLVVVGAPALLGLVLALAIAQFTIRYLNANTAFLISIILGNGINAPIILMARYGEERRRGLTVDIAIAAAMTGSFVATASAMAAASIAYGSLLLTSFRGFNQFGVVGGAGMLFVWLASMLLVPPLVISGERWWPDSMTPRAPLAQSVFRQIGKALRRRRRLIALLALAVLCGSLVPIVRYARDPLEWDFNKLRSKETEAQRNWALMEHCNMGSVGAGHIGTDGVILVDEPEQADVVAKSLKDRDPVGGHDHLIRAVRTLRSMLPQEQGAKLAILHRLRRKLDRHRGLLVAEEQRDLDALYPPSYLRELTTNDLPRAVQDMFTETTGERGRLIGIDAEPKNFDDWNGHDLIRLAAAMRTEALGKTWIAASTSSVFGGMVETIAKDGPIVMAFSLGGVALMVLLIFGLTGAVPVVTALAAGAAALVALLGIGGLKLNFVNFVALPITFGVGADYAANMWARLRFVDLADLPAAYAETGSAVVLCSTTTIIGYSSLLLASNRALQSFGVVADLGELTCLVVALVVLPLFVRSAPRRH